MQTHIYNLNDFEQHSGFNVLKSLEDALGSEIANKLYHTPEVWWCGGSAANLLVSRKVESDIDLFFNIEDNKLEEVKTCLSPDFEVSFQNSRCVKLLNKKTNAKVDLIIPQFTSPQATIDSFDLTPSMVAFDMAGNKIYVGEYTLFDLGRKKMAINRITYAASSLRRILKYQQKGFTICRGGIQEYCDQVVSNPDSVRVNTEFYLD